MSYRYSAERSTFCRQTTQALLQSLQEMETSVALMKTVRVKPCENQFARVTHTHSRERKQERIIVMHAKQLCSYTY